MSAIARVLARWLWYWMLWLMRRPAVRRMQLRSAHVFGKGREAEVLASMRRQDRLARKYGLRIITVCTNVLVASVLVTGTYMLVLYMDEVGMLSLPMSKQKRIEKRFDPGAIGER